MTIRGLKAMIGRMTGLECGRWWSDWNGTFTALEARRCEEFSEHVCGEPWGHKEPHRCRNCNRICTARTDDSRNHAGSQSLTGERHAADGAPKALRQGAGYPAAMPHHHPRQAAAPNRAEQQTPQQGNTPDGSPSTPGDEVLINEATATGGPDTFKDPERGRPRSTSPYRYGWLSFGPIRAGSAPGESEVEIRIGPDPVSATLRRLEDENADELLGRRWRLVWPGDRTVNPIDGSWATLKGAKRALKTALGEIAEEGREQISFSAAVPRTRPRTAGSAERHYSVRIFWYGLPCSGSIDYEAMPDDPEDIGWTVNIEPDDDTNLYRIDGARHKRLSEAKRHVTTTLQKHISARQA